MKKLLFFLITALLTFTVTAQTPTHETRLKSTRTNLALDTLGKDSVRYMTLRTALTPGRQTAVTVYIDILKISGTVGGSIQPQVKSGNNWYNLGSPVTISDSDQNHRIAIWPYQDKDIRIKFTGGASAMSASISGGLYAIKP